MIDTDVTSKELAGDQLSTISDEETPLVIRNRAFRWSRCVLRYKKSGKCVSSKAALLILFWSFTIGLWYAMALNFNIFQYFYPLAFDRKLLFWWLLGSSGFVATVNCFFPLAGFLADVKYGRYKTTLRSLFIILISIPCYIGSVILLIAFDSLEVIILSVLLGSMAFIFSYVGLAGFTANVVQFGMDQLHDSPGEDRTLFIHWYVWGFFATVTIAQLGWNLSKDFHHNFESFNYQYIGISLLASIILFMLVFLIITLCLARCRRSWFLIEPGGVNPYKLVYRVTKFAYQHKTPVRRSAFTYCEDEIPRGLDLGKEKYGGSFTTEQVEDVKVFYGILKVLLSFGGVFFLDFAASSVLPMYAFHTSSYFNNDMIVLFNGTLPQHILLNKGLLSPLLISICIPLYLCLLRPFISQYVPGMLKRMGLGMILALLSLIASFTMDTVGHMTSEPNTTTCMFTYFVGSNYSDENDVPIPLDSSLLIVQLTLSALSHMLIYTAVFEFICSQSPHSMKGLLIGLLYAIKGLYQVLATLLVVPFAVGYLHHSSDHFSCGFSYYLVNIVVGLIAVAVYVCVAKRYRYREGDEICNVHRFAEEFYSTQLKED